MRRKRKNKDIIKSITAVLLNYTCPNVKSKKVKVGLSRMILPACLPKRLGQQMFVALGYGCVH